jgi:TPR repeat protein
MRQTNYGRCLETGIGITKNASEAARYDKLSADHGNDSGQNHYGRCLENGFGITENASETVQAFRLGADEGLR